MTETTELASTAMALATKLVTAEELLAMPAEDAVIELIDGQIKKMSPAGFKHGDIAMLIGASLSTYVRQHGLGKVTAA